MIFLLKYDCSQDWKAFNLKVVDVMNNCVIFVLKSCGLQKKDVFLWHLFEKRATASRSFHESKP